MAVIQTDTKITTLWATTGLFIHLPPSILYSACLAAYDSNLRPTQAHGVLTLRFPDTNTEHISAALTSGYFGSLNPLGWTGKLPITAEEFLHAWISAPAASTIRLTAILVTPKPGQLAMDLLDA